MARSIAGGLELSWHGPTRRWYRSFRVNGKRTREYFGGGKNKHVIQPPEEVVELSTLSDDELQERLESVGWTYGNHRGYPRQL